MKSPIGNRQSQIEGDWTLDPLEARVLTLLRVRRGRAQAIKVPDLAALVYPPHPTPPPRGGRVREGVNPREVQEIVRRLREQHGCPILSSAGKSAAGGPGYWWAATAEELEECIREQRRKAISTLVVLRALRRHRARLIGQVEMSEVRRPRSEVPRGPRSDVQGPRSGTSDFGHRTVDPAGTSDVGQETRR